MMSRRVIAVALDGFRPPDESAHAMAVAASLADRAGASVVAVRLGSAKDGVPAPTARAISAIVAAAAAAMPGRVANRHVAAAPAPGNAGAVAVPSLPAVGEAFVAAAAGLGAGIVVVATDCAGEPLSGVAGAIVAAAEVPVVVVPPGVDHLEAGSFHVVVALDGMPRSGEVAGRIGDIYGWFQPSVSLLHVLHPGGNRFSGLPLLAHDQAARMLQRSAARIGECGVDGNRIHVVVRSGPASSVIVDHIRRERATLGILPVSGERAGHRRRHGVTNAVVCAAPVPIMLFQAAADEVPPAFRTGATPSW